MKLNMTNIDWSKIKTASGTAANMPKAFEYLKSKSLEERKKGYWLIDNHAVLQSDLYEAAYYVIDPLTELLKDYEIEEKSLIINLLIEITLGCAPNSVTINIGEEIISLKEACTLKLKDKKEEIETFMHKTKNQHLKNELNTLLNAIDNE